MQFHLNGFAPGNLQLSESARKQLPECSSVKIPSEVDVLIVGCGPAGLTLARQLAEFPEITTCIIDPKSGPMLFGQADGVSCRTIEIMEAYNASELILKESYWLNQITFWEPEEGARHHIKRMQKVPDPRMGLSEFPHVVLNQARIHDLLLGGMRNSAAQLEPAYNTRLVNVSIDEKCCNDLSGFPVEASIESIDKNKKSNIETIKARYIVGCDGARSKVRKCLEIPLQGDSTNKSWGVMDALAVTDFPDIRVKAFIKSENAGSILIVPREGGYLVRLYIELEQLELNQRAANSNIGLEELIAAAQRIFHPYELTIKEVPWWSVYEIGQRVAESFDNLIPKKEEYSHPRAFIAGDACHTHSPKAGQGMNVSIHDTFNLGWKLASVILNRSVPQILNTYSQERRAVAQDLITLDKDFTKLVAGKQQHKIKVVDKNANTEAIKDYFTKQTGFIAGTSIKYGTSLISAKPKYQDLAKGFIVGQRFHSEKVKRIADGRCLHLGHLNKADGRWRIFIFGDIKNPMDSRSSCHQLFEYLSKSEDSPIKRYTPDGSDIDSVIDIYTILQCRDDLSIEHLHDFLLPTKGKYSLKDYEKVFSPIPDNDIYNSRGINRETGCMVVVRPDQHVANILPLNGFQELESFFDGFMLLKL